jgi:hypothetical protein
MTGLTNRTSFLLLFCCGTTSLTLAAAGCTGDDTVSPVDASVDQTADTQADVRPPTDSGGDGQATDAPLDVSADVGRDGGPDVRDGGGADAPTLIDYPAAVNAAYCTRIAQCCLSANFDFAKCNAVLDDPAVGGVRGISLYNASLDAGTVVYDASAAAACLAEVTSIPCGLISAVDLVKLQTDCFAAMTGTIAVNANGCKTSLECVTGAYCDRADAGDGGLGTCAALAPDGGGCVRDEQCSYLAQGKPPSQCDNDAQVCEGTLPVDAGCNQSSQCASQLCLGKCQSTGVISDPGVPNGICDFFLIKDAGGGG